MRGVPAQLDRPNQSCRKGDQRTHKLQRSTHGDAKQTKWQKNEPHNRVQEQSHKGCGPADHKQNAEQKQLHELMFPFPRHWNERSGHSTSEAPVWFRSLISKLDHKSTHLRIERSVAMAARRFVMADDQQTIGSEEANKAKAQPSGPRGDNPATAGTGETKVVSQTPENAER